MKILIFSDSHLTHKFNQDLYDYISNLIKDVDQVIINGDFWDAYLTTFDKFINSEWKKLFPLLKKKNAIYIFGNHDKQKFMDHRYNLFSRKQNTFYEFKSGKRDFYVTHGHLISPSYDNILFFRNPSFVRFMYVVLIYLLQRIKILSRIHNIFEYRKNLEQLNELKNFTQKNKLDNQFFVFGHSHVPDLRISENFICLGPMQNKLGCYCLIDDGYIDLFNK